ncbi:MAG TPA: HypC/HybG/HupF family hydrogenase formation chaperone [Telmatospirillum sp.]|nr:HypC/HybG/HupF family hydrogenase formation chaperone [Telmatospirillum sp.]
MCIAVPVKIVTVLNETESLVLVEGTNGREEVCAALVSDGTNLLNRWAVVHSGFVLSLLDDEDARSRLSIFAAMDGVAVDDAALRPAQENAEENVHD